MSTFEALSIAVGFLTVLVLYLTYRAIVKYTEETKRIAIFTAEQASALPRPLITIEQSWDPKAPATEGDAARSLIIAGVLRFQNVGTAPAIKIRFRIGASPLAQSEESSWSDPLRIGEFLDTNVFVEDLPDPAEVVVTYETIGGGVMVTRATIEERRWVRNLWFERQPI